MKKHRHLFKSFSVALTMLLSSCNLLPQMLPSRRTSSREEISESSYFKDETSSKEDVSEHKHKYGATIITKEATCTKPGETQRVCSICGQVEIKETSPLGHDVGPQIVLQEPTCTDPGIYQYRCNRCGEVVETQYLDPLGHDFIYIWDKQPTCTEGGEGIRRCQRCYLQENYKEEALGHDLYFLENSSYPEPGKAKARVYSCSRCHLSYLNFNMKDLSPNSGRLVDDIDPNTGEVGKRFWGRPIGNAMELDSETGNASSGDVEKIYDPHVLGDYFEYVFDLTAEQASLLNDCILVCDVKPAPYLGGMDFWARGQNDAEWTPGYYIEGEHAGEQITNYRYILYVDGQPVEFDSAMKAPVSRGNNAADLPRQEVVMPYRFHLHQGQNSFSLHMAGGYRSTFFNFTFKTYEEEEQQQQQQPVDPKDIIQEWNYNDLISCRTDSGWNSPKDWGDGVQGFKFNKAGSVTLSIVSNRAMTARLELLIAVKYQNRTRTGFWKQDGVEKTRIEINGNIIEPPANDVNFENVVESEVTDSGRLSIPEWFSITDFPLVVGTNTITISFINGGYSYFLCGARVLEL